MSSVALWLLVILPAVMGAVLCASGRSADRMAAGLSVGTAALALVLAIVVAVRRPLVSVEFMAGARFGLGVDGLSAAVLPVVAAVTLLVLVFTAAEGTESPGRFHGLMLIFAAAVSVTSTATTLPTLLFAWELMGAMSYALIGFRWRQEYRVSAGLTAFLVTRTADLGLYLAAGAALAAGSGLDLADLAGASPGWRNVIAAGVLVAGLGKAAQLPFSFWLSRAMVGPSPVSALLHSAAMVAMGGYLLLREAPLLAATGWAGPAAAWAGALTALLLGAVALVQRDLKQLLAASTAAQLGFVVLAAGVGAVSGGTAQLMAHAATKALLFLAAGAWLTALGTKQLKALQGAARRWPLVGVTFGVGALSLAGVAPLALWATKDQVLSGALAVSPTLYAVGLAASGLSAAYSSKILFILWRRPVRPSVRESAGGYDAEQPGTRHIGRWEQVPLVILAVGAASMGLLTLPPLSGALAGFPGQRSIDGPGWLELSASAALALLVLAAVARFRIPQPRWAEDWLGLERAAHAVVVRPVLAAASALARFDDGALDGAVRASSTAGLTAARAAEGADENIVDAAVESVASRTRRLGRLARRPQTGRIHQYYAQAAVLLVAAAILLIVVR